MSTRTMSAKLMVEAKEIPVVKTMDVFSRSGEKLGYVEPKIFAGLDTISWHAVFSIGRHVCGVGLAQGHGDTPEEAIETAIKNTRDGIAHSSAKLDEIERKIYEMSEEPE